LAVLARTALMLVLGSLILAPAGLSLVACSGPPRLTSGFTPPDPPPVPRRKPAFSPTGVAFAAPAGAAETPVMPVGELRFHSVKSGDTVFSVARTYRIPLRTLIDNNNLTPPYVLHLGQHLVVPAARVHLVSSGDTVYGISRRYRVDMSELMRLNRIGPPYTIRVGQTLVLPTPSAARAATTEIAAAARPERPAPPQRASGAASASRQLLRGRDRSVPVPPRKPVGSAAARTPVVAPERWSGPIPQPPPRAGSRFLWPARGKVILTYGPKGGGLHNDGINIAAPAGAPIVAAENGVVAYAGNQLRGYGNLLLLRHADGWVTAYAHAEALLVRRGEIVRRGQTIARVGSSGSVDRPQLHFEIRKGAQAVDPMRQLARTTASAG
jgi:murein DD-endopeptidase MepM/ murein hydrolase activator NlpD